MKLPTKLKDDLYKTVSRQMILFERFLESVNIFCPELSIQSTQRYSAIYLGNSPIVYLEPQADGILMGFFRDYIQAYKNDDTWVFTDFPEWNNAQGGLTGYKIDAHEEYKILQQLGIAAELMLLTLKTANPKKNCLLD